MESTSSASKAATEDDAATVITRWYRVLEVEWLTLSLWKKTAKFFSHLTALLCLCDTRKKMHGNMLIQLKSKV